VILWLIKLRKSSLKIKKNSQTSYLYKMEKKKKEIENELVTSSWVNETSFSQMFEHAQKLVTSALVPFKKPEDLVLVWQYGKDIGLSFSQAISELYPIPGSGGTRVCAGVHIHEGILLAGDVQYQIIEDAVEVQHYKIKGLGTVILSMKEVQSKINDGYYQIVTGADFDKNGKLTVEKTAKFMIMRIDCPQLPEGYPNRRTSIRFIRKSKNIDQIVDYYLHEAAEAGFLSKSNWVQHQRAMLYARCFTKGAKRYGSDLLKNLGETSEVAQYSGIDYKFDEKGNATVDTSFEEIEEEKEVEIPVQPK